MLTNVTRRMCNVPHDLYVIFYMVYMLSDIIPFLVLIFDLHLAGLLTDTRQMDSDCRHR